MPTSDRDGSRPGARAGGSLGISPLDSYGGRASLDLASPKLAGRRPKRTAGIPSIGPYIVYRLAQRRVPTNPKYYEPIG